MYAGPEFLRIDSGFISTNEISLKLRTEDQTSRQKVGQFLCGKCFVKLSFEPLFTGIEMCGQT